MKSIELIISPTGEVRLETRRFNGSECQNASLFLESVLGKTTGESLTPLRELNSDDLFQGAREILIRHGDDIYRLRLTKNDRLILHK
jgi:hemin uptake protein HemP